MEYCPTDMMIADFYTKPLQGKMIRLFQNLILNLCEEDIRNTTLAEKLTKTEAETEDADRAIAAESVQERVARNNTSGIPNMGNCDVDSDDVNKAVDTREIMWCVKPDLLSRLKSVVAGAA